MLTYECPSCGFEARIRQSSLGTVQRCRNCRAKLKLWDEPGERPAFNHVVHVVLLFLTCGLSAPFWLLAWLQHQQRPLPRIVWAKVIR